MQLTLNGRPHPLLEGTALSGLVAALAPDSRGIAVAVNGQVVRAADWPTTTLGEGDDVEIVTAHQGG